MSRCRVAFVALVALAMLGGGWAAAAEKTPPKTPQAWTFEEAKVQLILNPTDVYLQYVVLQLGRGKQQAEEAAATIDELTRPRGWRRGPQRQADLFAMFTGALAVQEALQLDAMRGQGDGSLLDMADPAKNTVRVADLAGPTQKSHPWDKMLAAQTVAGRKPEVSPLSLCVPDDQLYLEFRSLSKLLEGIDAGDVWGSHLFNQAAKCAQSQRTSERLKTQLAIQTDPLSRPFYDLVVDEVAITTGDVFFREGTDVTMIFKLKQAEVFRARMDGYLDAAQKSRSDTVRSTGKAGEVQYVQVATPDRAVSAFSAYPRPELHIRSNSKAAMERVLAAVQGKSGVNRLGETTEFKYIRTLMVRGDKREDGFIYLSDPFIRRLTGPEVKLTERRRLLCYNHLRMIGHAAMLYRTQYGRKAESLDQLATGGCLAERFAIEGGPQDRRPPFYCPCGGKYALADDGATGVCSHHGTAHEMVPCRDVALERVTPREAEEYKRFLGEYNQYWRRYFDPIAIRLQLTPKAYRAETIILPLIDNTIYTTLAAGLGGEPEPLDALPVPKRNIFSVALRWNKEKLLSEHREFRSMFREASSLARMQTGQSIDIEQLLTKGLGNQVSMHVYDAAPMFDFDLTGFLGDVIGSFRGVSRFESEIMPISFMVASLNAPVYAAFTVKDPQIVDRFLEELDQSLAALARRRDTMDWLPVDFDFYKVPLKAKDERIRCYSVRFGPLKWRMFFARLDNALYVASKQFILEDLATAKPGKDAEAGPTAHAMIRVRPRNWKEVLPEYELGWAEGSREACLNNLGPLTAVARAALAENAQAKPAAILRHAGAVHGVEFFCPDGGKYELSADGKQVVCPVHGTAAAPKQLPAPAPNSPMGKVLKDFAGATAELTFLEDGLHAVVTLERK